MAAAARHEGFNPSADWTAAVEGAVRSELIRRRSWQRLVLGLSLLLTVATLALLAVGVLDVTELRRSVQPTVAATQRLQASQAAMAQRQAAIDARLREAETALAVLTLELQSPQAGRAASAAAVEATAPRRRRGPTPLERAVAGIDERLQRVEAASSAAEVDRGRIDERLQRLDEAVGRLGASLGPQSAP